VHNPGVTEHTRSRLSATDVYIHDDYAASSYADTPQFAVYGLNRLDGYPDQIFIVGGSSARAFTPQGVIKELPAYRVHNLCVDAANVTVMKELSELIDSHVDLRHLHSGIFVLTGQDSTFLENQREFRSPLTNIDQEKLRFYLYGLNDGEVTPVFRGPLMAAAVFLVRPFIWLYTLKYNIVVGAEEAREWLDDSSRHEKKTELTNKGEYFKALRLGRYEHRGLTDDQFNELRGLIHKLVALHITVVYVDLPVSGYVRNNHFIYDDYRRRVKAISGDPDVHYLDLSAWAPDGEFVDDSHAKPEFYGKWTAELARYLKTVVELPAQAHGHR
jgi:hypothetical protein